MTTNNVSSTGVGTDGVVPIYNPEGRFQVWEKSEIYVGQQGSQRYVPKVRDLVVDMDLGLFHKVISVDPASLISVLQEFKPIASGGELDAQDLLLGVGPGTQSDTYRVYLDKSVIPFALAVDARLSVAGSMVSYARIFRGADLTDQGQIISHVYDNAGNILGNKIPLELVSAPVGQNVAIKTVPVCNTMENLPDGEVVTAVFYSDAGGVVSKRQLLVENTAFIRSANLSTKYITGISLECPFLSQTDPRRIDLPINVLMQGLNMFGVVHYSDGSSTRLPVDGTKFTMLGLENFVATVVGQEASVVLRYRISDGEVVYGAGVGQFPHISQTYKVKTQQQDGAYSVKLFGYPVWLNGTDGYTMRWYLYNSDRDVSYNVTGLVEFAQNSPAFNPILYGVNQRLTVAVNLQAVNGAYNNYRHVQTLEVVLWREGTERQTNWTIAFDAGQAPVYGENNHADLEFVNANLMRLKIGMGEPTKEAWLQRLYYRTKPLIDPMREQVPPVPTHYRLRFGNFDLEFPIEQYADTQQIGAGLVNNGTLFIEFFRRTPQNDLQLAVAGVPIYQV